jgi:hypothetical protein
MGQKHSLESKVQKLLNKHFVHGISEIILDFAMECCYKCEIDKIKLEQTITAHKFVQNKALHFANNCLLPHQSYFYNVLKNNTSKHAVVIHFGIAIFHDYQEDGTFEIFGAIDNINVQDSNDNLNALTKKLANAKNHSHQYIHLGTRDFMYFVLAEEVLNKNFKPTPHE